MLSVFVHFQSMEDYFYLYLAQIFYFWKKLSYDVFFHGHWYAAVVWWSRAEAASMRTEVQCQQRVACIMKTRQWEQHLLRWWKSPGLAYPQVASLIAAYCLPRPDQKALEMGHGTIWKKAEKVDNKFVTTKNHTNPKYSLDKIYLVIVPIRAEWEKDLPKRLRKEHGTYSWKMLQKCYYSMSAIKISCYEEVFMLSLEICYMLWQNLCFCSSPLKR